MLHKIQNYELDLELLQNKIQVLEQQKTLSNNDKTLLQKHKSEIGEYKILEYINNSTNVKSAIYIRDFTEVKANRILDTNEFIQNKLNTYGCDLIVTMQDNTSYFVDLKVLTHIKYINSDGNKIYMGYKNDVYGVDNLVFQIYQNASNFKAYVDSNDITNQTKYGWGYNYYKNTDLLMMMIEPIGLYIIAYKELVKLMKYYVAGDYTKHYFKYKKQIVISIPCKDLPYHDGTIKFIKIDENVNNFVENNDIIEKNTKKIPLHCLDAE